jgi:AraC-like DNA-binding protein
MGTAVRSLVSRPGVGLTANVVQQSSLRLNQIAVDRPALIFLRHGTKTLRNGSQQWIAQSGDAVAVAGGQTLDISNRLSSEGLYEARWVVWDDAVIASANAGQPAGTLATTVLKRPSSQFTSAIDRAVEAILQPHHVPDAVARHRLAELLVWLAEHNVTFATRRVITMMEKLRSLFATAPSESWTISETAERFAMSESTLRRKLAAEGTNFAAVLSDLRMSAAMTLLQSTERPISHIASAVGYESPSRFSVRFRSRFGFAPSQVRGQRGT